MRRVMKRRAAAHREAERQAVLIVEERGPYCQICGQLRPLQAHEIAQGTDRAKARGARCATLVLCQPCHAEVHRGWPKAKQLALLQFTADYDLAAYNAIDAPPVIHQEDVDRFLQQLKDEGYGSNPFQVRRRSA